MVRLREIPRTAAFAWSPGSAPPLLATGTRAGAVDDDFSDETNLELWDLQLDQVDASTELAPVGSIPTDSKFYDIAWSQPTADRSRGIIAGALENGSLDLWDAEKLRSSPSDSFMSRTTKHSGAIKTVQFNHSKHELLATAGAKGELFIYDLNNVANPFRLGGGAARADDFECLDWNKGSKVPHILATGSSGGFVTIWDVRQKKENLTLNNYGRKPVSAVAWDPDVATKLMTAIPNDQDPLILMWDLRNSSAPERVLRGHELGVLSLSWCLQDSSLLLSCGKDNRTVAWNPHTGESYGDFPVVTNWTFQTRWNPHNPGLLATASFDGKIAVQTIQNTNSKREEKTTAQQALEGEDFFNQVQTQPQHVSFSLPKAPKWMERPAAVSFGFGGKLVRLATDSTSKKSTVSIETFAVDSAVTEASQKFEESLKGGDLASICEAKISAATNEEEKADWQVIETLNAGKSRKKLREYLGFAEESDEITTKTAELNINGDAEKPKEEDDNNFFGNGDANGEDGDNFLADLAATKGAKTNQPFHIFSGEETDADKNITRALMIGNFESALDVCLKDGRMSDAFMIAICGGQKCMDKVQTAYLKQKAKGPNYLRLLASIVGRNLWDVVHNADLSNWKEVMATLCTFADETEFSDLCEALGDRLEESLADSTDKGTLRRDASFCFLAGSKLEKVVTIWAQELQEKESAGLAAADGETSFSVHARSLQDFIEKVTVFRQVVGFQDADRQANENWKLAPLYTKYTEYADILASHGQLQVAEKYLDLLPSKYPAAEVAQQRVKLANRTKPVAPQIQRQPAAASRITAPTAPYSVASAPAPATAANPYAPSGGIMSTPAPAGVASGYAPPGAVQPAGVSNLYAPPTQAYAPVGYQPQQTPSYGQPGPYGAPAAPIAPPRGMTPSTIPPPPKKIESQQWNDLPEGFTKPVQPARRNTPSMVAVSSPFPNNPGVMSPPPPGSAYGQQPATALPPPPKAGQMPPRVMSPLSGPPQIQRPISAASNAYIPQAPVQQSPASTLPPPPQAPPLGRGPSPYNPPPNATASGPASNRYAPAPGSQPAPTVGGMPPRNVAPPPNPYGSAAPSPYAPAASAYAPRAPVAPYSQAPTPSQPPASQAFPPPPQGPPRGPPQGPPRAAPPPQATPVQATPPPSAVPQQMPSRPSTAQSQRSAPAAAKYPPGDRTQIPSNAMPIYEILSQDMARVKQRAPASFIKQVTDAETRLNILFDHLNNGTLIKPDTIAELVEISQALQARDFDRAGAILTEVMKAKLEAEGANWMVGVKRLVAMSKATPV